MGLEPRLHCVVFSIIIIINIAAKNCVFFAHRIISAVDNFTQSLCRKVLLKRLKFVAILIEEDSLYRA